LDTSIGILPLYPYVYAPFPSAIHFTLKIEAAWPSKTLVFYNISTWCHNLEDCDFYDKCFFHCMWEHRYINYVFTFAIKLSLLNWIKQNNPKYNFLFQSGDQQHLCSIRPSWSHRYYQTIVV